MANKPRAISNDEIKRQLLSGGKVTTSTTLKRRHLPTAFSLFRHDELAKRNINVSRTGKSDHYHRAMESINRKWDISQDLHIKYNKIRSVIDNEMKAMRAWELEMIRYGEIQPASMVINDASWHWQQDQFKFVHPRLRARNTPYQFVKNLKRFGANKAVQRKVFCEVFSEFKACDPTLKLLANPTIAGKGVDLFELYRCIVLHGGIGRTLKKTVIWKECGAALRLSGTPDTLFYLLRVIYFKFLLLFEHKHQITKQRGADLQKIKLKKRWIQMDEGDENGYDFEYISSKKKRRKKMKKKKNKKIKRKRDGSAERIPFDSVERRLSDYSSDDIFYGNANNKKRKIVSKIEDKSHFNFNGKNEQNVCCVEKYQKNGGMNGHFDAYWNGFHQMKAIILCLESQIGASVNWALNRLLFLSFNSKAEIAEPFVCKYHAKELIDALMALLPPLQQKNAMRNDLNCLLDPTMTRSVLRILSNLALTAENIQCMAEHALLMQYLLELTVRRDFVPSDVYFAADADAEYSEIHLDAVRILAFLSQKVSLPKFTKKYLESEQAKRYKMKIPMNGRQSFINNSRFFVDRLMQILSILLAKSAVIDSKEHKHWMLYYALTIIGNLSANPNNHGILNKFVKHTIDNQPDGNVKFVDLSSKLSLNGMVVNVPQHLMIFGDEKEGQRHELR